MSKNQQFYWGLQGICAPCEKSQSYTYTIFDSSHKKPDKAKFEKHFKFMRIFQTVPYFTSLIINVIIHMTKDLGEKSKRDQKQKKSILNFIK